jgi:acetyl/propionyl-CoA carboxylase alpha subunit
MDSATIAKQIADYDGKRVTSTDALNEALGQFGVPEIRKNVSALRTTIANTTNALNGVDPSVTGRTSNSLVTEAQRQKQVANERAPIAQQLSSQTGAYQTASGDLGDATNQATSIANNRVNDWNTGRSLLQGQYDQTYKREQDDMARAVASEQERRRREESDREFSLASTKVSNAAGGKEVDPAQEFLSYISGQFKSAGGQGSKNITRQQQDAWADQWFAQNGVSKANRQGYWDLFNKSYNRTNDPTKDWRWAR